MSTESETTDRGDNVEGYALLRAVLDEAFDQSARGKGAERHANGRYFDQQPIMEIGRMVGPGFATGQVMKKAQEATSMAARGESEAAVRELLGVIVYAASAVALVREAAPCAVTDRRSDKSDMDLIQECDRRRASCASGDRSFKVGDRVQVKGFTGYGKIAAETGEGFLIQWDGKRLVGSTTWGPDELTHVN